MQQLIELMITVAVHKMTVVDNFNITGWYSVGVN
jgi:hypothetical protein